MTDDVPGLGEEIIGKDEQTIIEEILNHNRELMVEEGGVKRRAQHAKHHGCARAIFRIRKKIPEKLKVGLFRYENEPFDALIRFSNGLQHDDRQADAHGMAIKVLGVPGEKLEPDPEAPDSIDFILVDHPVMFARTLGEYRAANELVHDVVDNERSEGNWFFKKIRKAKETAEAVIEGGLRLLVRLKRFASQRPLSPLATDYWSQTPYKLGEGQAVKYMAQAQDDADLPETAETKDMLREALQRGLAAGEAKFVFGVHVQQDPVAHPLENATVPWWSEDEDPGGEATMVPLADIEITGLVQDGRGERIAFSPWNVPEDHRPLGGINRVRRRVYRELASLRR